MCPAFAGFYAFNPVALLSFAAEAHFDALMLAPLVWALYLFETGRSALGHRSGCDRKRREVGHAAAAAIFPEAAAEWRGHCGAGRWRSLRFSFGNRCLNGWMGC